MDIPTPSSGVKVLMYADDIIVYGCHRRIKIAERSINGYLSELSDFFNKWKLKANPEKCQAIKMWDKKSYKNIKRHTTRVTLNNSVVQNTKKIVYLGLTLKENYNFTPHVNKIIQKASGALTQYYRAIHQHSRLSKKIKLVLYKQIIRTIISYAFPAWFHIPKSALKKIKIFERKCLRSITGLYRKPGTYEYHSNHTLYEAAKIEPIDKYLMRMAYNFINNAETIENDLISSIFEEDISLSDRRYHIKHLKEVFQQVAENN
jgi:hypothetical protein